MWTIFSCYLQEMISWGVLGNFLIAFSFLMWNFHWTEIDFQLDEIQRFQEYFFSEIIILFLMSTIQGKAKLYVFATINKLNLKWKFQRILIFPFNRLNRFLGKKRKKWSKKLLWSEWWRCGMESVDVHCESFEFFIMLLKSFDPFHKRKMLQFSHSHSHSTLLWCLWIESELFQQRHQHHSIWDMKDWRNIPK